MELAIQTLPCGCITETNKLEKDASVKTIKTCETHSSQEGYANEIPLPEGSNPTTIWIYIGVAVIAVIGLAYFAVSTYGLPTGLVSSLPFLGLSGTASTT